MARIGSMELIVFLIIAFFAIGPERLPQAAKTLGKALGQLKKEINSAKSEIMDSSEELRSVEGSLKDAQSSLKKALSDTERDMNRQGAEIRTKLSEEKANKRQIKEASETEQEDDSASSDTLAREASE